MFAKDFRREAREALQGHWAQAVGTGFVASLLGAGTSYGSSLSSSINQTMDDMNYDLYYSNSPIVGIIFGILSFLVIVLLILALVQLFVSGAASLGYARYNLNLVSKNKEANFSDLFSMFHLFWKAFLLALLQGIFVFLWMLLFIIPGIVAAYRYSMAFYIMCENPEMSPLEAISASKELMKGYKFKLFCLEFSFIGWYFLCLFTLGIGTLWLTPYVQASAASFYCFVCREKYGDSFREIPNAELPQDTPSEGTYYEASSNYTNY